MIQIEDCKRGDRKALEQLYRQYAGKLLSVCRHYIKDESAAEDVLHDAFIIIFTSIKDLKDTSKIEGWMITIARNLCFRYLRSIGKKEIPLEGITEHLCSDCTEEQKEVDLQILFDAIEKLPEKSKEVFKLSVLDGYSHIEIGQMLHIAPHSSSSQLFRAKTQLQKMLYKYWVLLLLPMFLPICLYLLRYRKTENIAEDKSQAVKVRREKGKTDAKENHISKDEYIEVLPMNSNSEEIEHKSHLVAMTDSMQTADSTQATATMTAYLPDSVLKVLALEYGTWDDTLFHIPQITPAPLIAQVEPFANKSKKKYPWTFNFGFSSNTGGNALSDMNYLSVIDYANGGAVAKLHTWNEYMDYMTRNSALMDSVERKKMKLIAWNNMTDGDSGEGLGEKATHHRPLTFSLSLNKQLSPHWIFGTGITYTHLKSKFESDFHGATLNKVQKIDYIGIPLRLTYRIWSKGRFNAYTTSGVTFEMPIRSSLSKQYIITADSSYTLKGTIRPRYQWSVNMGVGVQYRLFKPFSIYVEPNMFYYFRNGSGLETYRTEHPFTLTVPFGLRLTW